jgi:hypothetical protein
LRRVGRRALDPDQILASEAGDATGYGPGPVPSPAGNHSVWLYVGIALVACLLGAMSVWIGMRIAVAAADDCGVDFDAGGSFALGMLLLFLVPTVAAANCLLSLLAARFRPAAGLIVALSIPLGIALLLIATHALSAAQIIPSLGPDYGSACPSGVPQWWPSWMPR